MAIKPITRYGKFTPTGVDKSGEIRMRALAGLGETAFDITRDVVKTKREQESTVEGIKAAEESRTVILETGKVNYADVELRSGYGFGDAQFNRAALSTMNSQRDVDSRIKFDKLEKLFPLNPQGFETASNAYIDGVESATPLELRSSLRTTLTARKLSKLNIIIESKRLEDIKNATRKNVQNINEATDAIEVLVASNKNPATEVDSATASIDAQSEIDPDFNAEEAKSNLNKTQIEATLRRKNDDLFDKNPERAFKNLDEQKLPEGYTPPEWDKVIGAETLRLRKRQQLQENAYKSKQAEQKRDFDNGVALLNQGRGVDQKTKTNMEIFAEDTGQLENLKDAFSINDYMQLSSTKRLQILEDTEAQGLEGAVLYGKLKTVQETMDKALDKDPMSYAISQGVVTLEGFDAEQFDPLNPTQEELDKLYEFRGLASQHYFNRQTNFPIFTKNQANTLVTFFESDTFTFVDKATLARTYGERSGIWNLFEGKKGVYAQAATNDNEDVTLGIFAGLERLKRPEYKILGENRVAATNDFYEYVGLDTISDDDAFSLIDASFAYYAGSVNQNEKYNADDFKLAIKDVVGQVEDIRGFKTLLPTGVSEEEFEKYFDMMTEAEYIEIAGDKTSEQIKTDLELIKDDGVLFGVFGEPTRIKAVVGGYQIIVGNGVLTNAQEEPLVIKLDRNILDTAIMNSPERQLDAEKQAVQARRSMGIATQRPAKTKQTTKTGANEQFNKEYDDAVQKGFNIENATFTLSDELKSQLESAITNMKPPSGRKYAKLKNNYQPSAQAVFETIRTTLGLPKIPFGDLKTKGGMAVEKLTEQYMAQ